MNERRFDAIAFDLDDTLLETSRLLVPQAARESVAAMIGAGLNADLDQALTARSRLLHARPRAGAYEGLTREFGVRSGATPEAVIEAGRDAFLRREVDPQIELSAPARTVVESLRLNYKLFLVTAGDPATQMRKVEILRLQPYFEGVYVVNSSRGERKFDAFASIAARTGALPERCLSVGNRVDTDVAEARAQGWKACWVRLGEHARMVPETELERPDFQVDDIEELAATCGL